MREPRVNGGISGHLNYSAEMIEELKGHVERLKEIYPIADIKIELASLEDNRWKKYNGSKNKV